MRKGKENLVSLKDRTKEEQRKIATAGGKASGEARRRKKALGELAQIMLAQELKGENKKSVKAHFSDVPDGDMTFAAGILAGQISAAMKGNTKAAE